MRKPRTNEFITTPKPSSDDKRSQPVSILLLAENHGYRMKSYGPISLVVVDGKALIEHQIEAISSTFLNFEIIVCSGFETLKFITLLRKGLEEV